jgi:hypothetical protein
LCRLPDIAMIHYTNNGLPRYCSYSQQGVCRRHSGTPAQ